MTARAFLWGLVESAGRIAAVGGSGAPAPSARRWGVQLPLVAHVDPYADERRGPERRLPY
ncbi:hypothetical protein ACSNN9_08030 [Micromonospora sp. URMC 107]|uniref:hypothetical protein n=1 Tax=Micromonospora sp. URMC 107 TaxID=3423418 RepID=UPI003F1BC121